MNAILRRPLIRQNPLTDSACVETDELHPGVVERSLPSLNYAKGDTLGFIILKEPRLIYAPASVCQAELEFLLTFSYTFPQKASYLLMLSRQCYSPAEKRKCVHLSIFADFLHFPACFN